MLEYEGTNYCGWQTQNRRSSCDVRRSTRSVQETLEKALLQILQKKTKVIGSGRTDSGVHAEAQVASFLTDTQMDLKQLSRALNGVLPKDIKIARIQEVSNKFHARFSAKSKLYRYTVVNNQYASPFIRQYAHLVKQPLDVKRMRQAAKYFLGRHDFRSFQAADKKQRHSVRKILLLDIKKRADLIQLYIEADGFLYKMARNIAGTLIEVGRGRLLPPDIAKILKTKDRKYAGPCAPARGLCLMRVKYKS